LQSPIFLSIIIPAHNEAHRLPGSLDQILNFLAAQPYKAEVLVVENGSQDDTFQIAQTYTRKYPQVLALQEINRGKGLAVRAGMLQAKGEYRFMCDADLSMPIEEVNRFIPPDLEDFDIAIASREIPGAKRYNEPEYRHFIGRGYNTLIRLLALPGLQDTQCGFKCLRGPVAEDIFRYQTLDGMSFDVEMLFIARLRKYRIKEIPIPWYFNPDSRVKIISDSIQMGLDLLTIRQNAAQGLYDGEV
jgi:glycosyltransferase involved in cell wall biosynthesis